MNAIDDGGPAFPLQEKITPEGILVRGFEPGMTLLDYFASDAMKGMLAHGSFDYAPLGTMQIYTIATCAYKVAVAMVAARNALEAKTP